MTSTIIYYYKVITYRGLLQAVSDNGFHILEKISGNVNYGFEGMKIPVEVANQRLEFVCEFYKNHLDKTSNIGQFTM